MIFITTLPERRHIPAKLLKGPGNYG